MPRLGAARRPTMVSSSSPAHTDNAMAALRADVRAGDEETRRYLRILHEDVISRLKTIRQG